METTNRKSTAFLSLAAATIIFTILPSMPFGYYVQWPFEMLTTYVHELGHGLGAIAMGGNFIELKLFVTGGGVAISSGVPDGVGRAVTAASGLLAPSIVGGLFILAGRSKLAASTILIGFSGLMLLSCALWIRSVFGLTLVGGLGLVFLIFGMRSSQGVHQFLIQFFAVHMLVDTLTGTMSYLFTESFERDGQLRHSDTANIAANLGGTYWAWGIVIALISISIFYFSFRRAYLK